MNKIKAIETQYKGYRFRSRLEARWAVFFETLGCRWEYEPEGFDLNGLYYLPDFKVVYPGGSTYWFEVKSSVDLLTRKDIEKMTLFARYVDDIYLLDGTPEYGAYINFSSYHLLGKLWKNPVYLHGYLSIKLRCSRKHFNNKRHAWNYES